jgi:hypothetical protein
MSRFDIAIINLGRLSAVGQISEVRQASPKSTVGKEAGFAPTWITSE